MVVEVLAIAVDHPRGKQAVARDLAQPGGMRLTLTMAEWGIGNIVRKEGYGVYRYHSTS